MRLSWGSPLKIAACHLQGQYRLALSIAATFSSSSGEPWLIDNSFRDGERLGTGSVKRDGYLGTSFRGREKPGPRRHPAFGWSGWSEFFRVSKSWSAQTPPPIFTSSCVHSLLSPTRKIWLRRTPDSLVRVSKNGCRMTMAERVALYRTVTPHASVRQCDA